MRNEYEPVIAELEAVFGGANSSGFGSAVFSESVPAGVNPDVPAPGHYRKFIGDKWTDGSVWMSTWLTVYRRKTGGKTGILAELDDLKDSEVNRSVPLLTELMADADRARRALTAAFDHPAVEDLAVHRIGDGEALEGVVVTGIFAGDFACSVICLMD